MEIAQLAFIRLKGCNLTVRNLYRSVLKILKLWLGLDKETRILKLLLCIVFLTNYYYLIKYES